MLCYRARQLSPNEEWMNWSFHTQLTAFPMPLGECHLLGASMRASNSFCLPSFRFAMSQSEDPCSQETDKMLDEIQSDEEDLKPLEFSHAIQLSPTYYR